MVVHFLRLSSRRALNYRKFSTSAKFGNNKARLWVPLVIGGGCAGCAAAEFVYPNSVTGKLPFFWNNAREEEEVVQDPVPPVVAPVVQPKKPKKHKKQAANKEDETGTETDKSLVDDSALEKIVPVAEQAASVVTEPVVEVVTEQNTDSVTEIPIVDVPSTEIVETHAETENLATVENASDVPLQSMVVADVVTDDETVPVSESDTPAVKEAAYLEEVPILSIPDDDSPPCIEVESTIESTLESTLESTTEPTIIESTICDAFGEAPLNPATEKVDEAQIIMDALNSLDYEPVLSDSILELLVGKAASREKAVVATISRLENAMASVVNEVQLALEHHNTTSSLVAVARDHAQCISEATSKDTAKGRLEQLIESSSAVRSAFEEGEVINARVTGAFNKLSEIIEKAEQFNLEGPVSAARTLLNKSRSDYYSSCEVAQENQVDHALLSHYQQSVTNRKKVLDRELEILRDHFPKQHVQLNQTFQSAEHHRAQVDELNTLITYLSNKVGRLETELEEQQAAELVKLKMVAEAQKAEDARILEERLRGQAEQLRYQHEAEQQAEVEAAVAAARDESARHAAKQAQILKQEMKEATERQIRDLTAFWSDEAALRESVVEVEYQCKLEKTNSLIASVGATLDIQSERYRSLVDNLRLLNLTTALYDTVNTGETVDEHRVRASVSLLKSEYSGDELVSAVTATIPDSVSVTTFSQLNDRLRDLATQCRRAALVTSEDCGVGSRILSRVMSLLTLDDSSYNVLPEEGGSHTLYFLTKARQEMGNNNLDLATRYLNKLAGEPRTLVQDWLRDARTLLEMRQSTSVLLNYAKSRNDLH